MLDGTQTAHSLSSEQRAKVAITTCRKVRGRNGPSNAGLGAQLRKTPAFSGLRFPIYKP